MDLAINTQEAAKRLQLWPRDCGGLGLGLGLELGLGLGWSGVVGCGLKFFAEPS